MPDGRATELAVSAALHELAAGLQATGSYLDALRRRLPEDVQASSIIEITERAMSQCARAQRAMKELRTRLETGSARSTLL